MLKKLKNLPTGIEGLEAAGKITLHGRRRVVAEHFVQAEVKIFSGDALDSAIAWAGGAADPVGE